MAAPLDTVTAVDARRVLLTLQGLSESPKRSSARAVQTLVERLGYVQIDSINVVERAHHLILGTRLEGYRPAHFTTTLEKTRGLFEHWTHDASAVPTKWLGHWKHRFDRYGDRIQRSAWWQARFRGDPEVTIRRTLARVRKEGPLLARDFEAPADHVKSGWWEWHPEKAALEHLWRSGRLGIARRDGFEKVYDLLERVLPQFEDHARTDEAAHLDWACREAVDRLGFATPRELAQFFGAITLAEARSWYGNALRSGEFEEVLVEHESGRAPVKVLARPGWKALRRSPDPDRMLALCPFDPVVRDRQRLERLFRFDYRFEAFTPAAKRRYGYYVLPLLEGDRLIGRIDPKFDRSAGTLIVRGPWWEAGVKRDAARRRRLEQALNRLASQIGADRWSLQRQPTR